MENRLKMLRKEAGKTQEEIAELLNISQGSISNWELGKTDIDKVSLIKLAAYYNASIDFIMGVTDERTALGGDSKWMLKEYLADTFGRKFTDDDVRAIEKIIGDIEDYKGR